MFKTYYFRTGFWQDSAISQRLKQFKAREVRRRLCKKVGEECLFLQLQDLSTRSGLSEGEAHDEASLSMQRLKDAGPDSQSMGWDGFHALPHPSWWEITDTQGRCTRVWLVLLFFPENTTACFHWNKSSQAGSTTSLNCFL